GEGGRRSRGGGSGAMGGDPARRTAHAPGVNQEPGRLERPRRSAVAASRLHDSIPEASSMRNEASKRTRGRFLYAVLIVIAATVACLGVPSLLAAASQTIFCNGTLIANSPQSMAHLGWSVSADREW